MGYPGSSDRSKNHLFQDLAEEEPGWCCCNGSSASKLFTFTIAIDLFIADVEAAYESKVWQRGGLGYEDFEIIAYTRRYKQPYLPPVLDTRRPQ